MADAFGPGSVPESKRATNKGEARQDEDRGRELLLAVLLGMGYRSLNDLRTLTLAQRAVILNAICMETSSSLTSITRDLINKKITPRVWFIRMRDILLAASSAGALVLLGIESMTDDELDAWVSEINLQYGYLTRFRNEIQDGSQILGDVAIARADLYARAIWSTSWRVLVASWLAFARSRGEKAQFLRHLGAAEHCRDCIAWAAEGWVDEEDFHPIGSSVCGSRCHCTVSVRFVPLATTIF